MSNQRAYKKRVMRNNDIKTKRTVFAKNRSSEISTVGEMKFRVAITPESKR